jgi:hypothetical protein
VLIFFTPLLAEAAEKAPGYDAFALVKTRHIFDPNRRAPVKQTEQRPTAPSRPRSVHLALTGTMVTEARALAFFSGSRTEFNKIVGVGERIGDFTVASITGSQVELKQGDTPSTLIVGKRLQLEGTEADTAEPEPASATGDAPATSPNPTNSATPASPAPSGGSPSEIMKRMMERRAQEMKK